MNLSEPFIKRSVMTTILMFVILFLGCIAFQKLPVTDLPNVDYPSVNVTASYLGASPEVMARSVALPIEKELVNINGIKHITSESSRGFTWLHLVFDLDRDGNEVAQDVQSALKRAEASLPPDLDQKPTYHKVNPSQDSIIYLVLTSSSSPLSEIYDYAHSHIEQKVSRIEGVGKVQIHGSPYAARIFLNPELMAARNITLDEVRKKVAETTKVLPLGNLDTPGRKFTLEVPPKVQNITDIANISITPHVRLKEIAEVSDGLKSDEIFHYVTKEENKYAVVLSLQKQSGANAVKISEELKKLLPEIRGELPPTMQLEFWFDKAKWIKEAIEDVEWSLVIAFVLVIGVIFLSLGRLAETLIAGVALPLSIIGTFIIMQALHFNLDILSLLALTLSMGFIIDDAIVVLENIVRYRELGCTPLEAALRGSKQISFTVLSMTLSLVAVFIPLLFMQDITGRLFREFSITLAISILVSGFISLSLTPMLASKYLSSHQKATSRVTSRFLSFYGRTLKWCIKHHKMTLSFALGITALTALLFKFLSINLFPEEDRGFINSFIQCPSGMSKKDTELYQEKLNLVVQKHPAVESFVTLNFKDYQIFLIRLIPTGRSPQSTVVTELQSQLNAIPGTQAFMRGVQLISDTTGSRSKNQYRFVLRGSNHEEVRKSGEELKQKLLLNPVFVNPDLNIKAEDPKLEISVFEDLAKELGLSRESIQTLLQSAYAGGTVGKIERDGEKYDLILELDSRFQKNTNALSKLYLKTSSGSSIPLKAVASWKESVGLQSIEHVDLLPSVTLSFALSKGAHVEKAFTLLTEIAKDTLPSSVSGKLSGLADMVNKTGRDTIFLLVFAFIAMYVVLSILYESFIHPFTILSALPFACLGGILTLLVCKEPLSLYSMVGFLLLIGIVKKNGIMMVDYALEMQRKENKTPHEAIQEACLVRFRPIMMTTVAAVMGSVPIAIGIGAGAETRRGLGLVIVGGLLFSQFLTLYITPIFYLYLEKLRKWRR